MPGPQGPSSAQATRLLETIGPNAVPLKRTGLAVRILRKLWAPVPWMLEATIVFELALAKSLDSLIILAVLSLNTAPGIIQEKRSEAAVDLLRTRLEVNARVLRDGTWTLLPAARVVPGDVIGGSVALLWASGQRWPGGGLDQLRTVIFLTLVFSSQITSYVVRTARPAWTDRPSRLLVAAWVIDIATAAGGFIVDLLKVPAFRKLKLHVHRGPAPPAAAPASPASPSKTVAAADGGHYRSSPRTLPPPDRRQCGTLNCGFVVGAAHPYSHDDSRQCGEDTHDGDRRRDAVGIGEDAGEECADGESAVAPQPVDPYRAGTPDRVRDVADGGQQGGVDHGGAGAEQDRGGEPDPEAGPEGDHHQCHGLDEHASHDQPFPAVLV
ncbi:hypothetical protein E5206_11575 [Arthrobacter sp. PAMC25564]|nr:hypothetical protein E5206_11575 [Arthrobacter sp. PAMC25564]